jgi:hypothetical protein
MKNWMVRMHSPLAARTYALVNEPARQISACRLTFFTDRAGSEVRQNGAFVQTAISLPGISDDVQTSL